jgi:hypothetical protein
MDDVIGLVICRVCDRSGPGVEELIALPVELEAAVGSWVALRG